MSENKKLVGKTVHSEDFGGWDGSKPGPIHGIILSIDEDDILMVVQWFFESGQTWKEEIPREAYQESFKSDKILKCPMCDKPMCVMDKMDDMGYNSDTPDIVERVIIFEYNCSNPECGMSGYYPFDVSEVPDGEDYFEQRSQKSEKSESISDLSSEEQVALEQKE